MGDDAIREGIRRIGEVVREQVALYGRLTGAEPAPRSTAAPAAPPAERPDPEPRVLPLRRKAG